MTFVISDSDVRQALNVRSLVTFFSHRLASAARDGSRLSISSDRAFLRLGGALISGDRQVIGYKAFHAGEVGGVRYLVVLADGESGKLLALIDGAYLTAMRTGAVTAVACQIMARPEAERFGIIGSGEEAWANFVAVSCVRTPRHVSVFSPRATRRVAFAERVRREFGVEARAVASAAEAVEGAQLVIVATNSRRHADPIAFREQMLAQGMHVNSIGSTTAELRELDERVMLRADTVVFDTVRGAQEESGDVQAAVAAGLDLTRVRELGAVLRSGVVARRSPEAITVFKSVGSAVQDIAAAEWVLTECLRLGLGEKVELGLHEKVMEL